MTTTGYSRLSIMLHWIAAIGVIALFLTHEGDRGSAAFAFHVGGGAVIGVILLWRVAHRLRRGFTTPPSQSALLNMVSKIVMWGFLAALVVVVVTGYFIPWSVGQPIDIYGIVSLPSPIGRMPALHEFLEEAHEIAGQLFVPLLALHVLGAFKHAIIDKDGVFQRMMRPVTGGK